MQIVNAADRLAGKLDDQIARTRCGFSRRVPSDTAVIGPHPL